MQPKRNGLTSSRPRVQIGTRILDGCQRIVPATRQVSGGMAPPAAVDALADAFRTGGRADLRPAGPVAAHHGARMSAPWARLLVRRVIPALEGVADRLRAVGRVVDVACGGGLAFLAVAGGLPASQFEALDPSRHAIERAQRAVVDTSLRNGAFRVGTSEDLAPVHDLVLTFDCLHDIMIPTEAAEAILLADLLHRLLDHVEARLGGSPPQP